MNKFIDYYTMLNILPTASDELIKRAYRIQSKEMHPDQGGDERTFILLTDAYEVLSNPAKRREYDQQYSFYQQTHQRTKKGPKEERNKPHTKDESNFQKVNWYFPFDYKRFGKLALGGFISLGILAKAINAFEESAEPEIPINPIVFPLTASEESNETTSETVINEELLDEKEETEVEVSEQAINIGEDIEAIEEVIIVKEEDEVNDTSRTITTDSPSLYFRYLDRIYKLEDDLQDYGNVWGTGSDAEITQASYIQLIAWDDLLNEIYQSLKLELPEADFVNLRDLQRIWIVEKDQVANAAIIDFSGGSWEVPVYNDALMQETRKRCYWLVMNYMN